MSDGTLTVGRTTKRQPLLRLLSDERLLKLASEGSTPAFAAIYERHHQAVYRYARSILRSDHDARDVLQSSMLKALQALEDEHREIELRPWLFRIAHNEAVSLLRSRRLDEPIDGASEIAALESDPEARERLRSLIADLDQLSLRQRSALLMRELNGLEFEEIGHALDASPEAAKQAVYEARLALHELEEGREMTCDEVRRKISAEDRRLLKGRRVRGHLRSCESCEAFARSSRARRSQLACIAPPLPAPAALGILEGLIGGGTGGGGLGALAGGGAAAGLGGSTAIKLGAVGVLALGIGTAALENDEPRVAAGASSGTPPTRTEAAQPVVVGEDQGRAPRPSREEPRAGRSEEGRDRGGGAGSRGGGVVEAEEAVPGGSGSSGDGSQGPGAGHTPPGALVPAPVPDTGAPSQSGGGSSDSGGEGTPPPPPPPSDSTEPPAGGRGPAGVPPGQGGTPPGQGGTPPGLGAPPPGQTGTPPGHGGPSPGQGGAPPGRGP